MDEVDDQSMTIDDSIRPLFDDSPYVLSIIDNFYANTMNYSKQQNSTERFLYFIGRHNAEFNIPIGTQTVQIRNKIGVQRNDVFIHEDDNLVDFNITTDTGSFCTAIKGYYRFRTPAGSENSTDKEPTRTYDYISPMADKYGVIWGEPIHDERFDTLEGIQAATQEKQESTWKSSFEISAELFDVPLGIGDEVRFIVPSKSINGYIRVVEINEQFDEDGELIEATYTFGNENIANSYRNMQYESIQDLHDLMLGKRKLPYNVLPNAVREATAVINAGESSSFEYRRNGIYGFNTENPLGVTRYNANGIGFSQDGGQTFENALTYLGLTASAITTGSMTANRIHGGVLTSINSNTTFNLNTGFLDMANTRFRLGGGADIEFSSAGNRLYYERADGSTTRTSGLGVGTAINNRFPIVWMGTTGTTRGNFDPSDGNYFTGFIANTSGRYSSDGIQNSVVGNLFQVRDEVIGFNRGFEFHISGSTHSFRGMSTNSNDYNLGERNAPFTSLFMKGNIHAESDFAINNRTADGPIRGWRIETNYSGNGDAISLYGLNGDSYNYQLGSSRRGSRLMNIYLTYEPDVSSDLRLKENVETSELSLEFINALKPSQFRLRLTEADKNQGINSNPLQQGLIAQDVAETLKEHGMSHNDISLLNVDDDGYLSLRYSEFITPVINSVQKIDKKVESNAEKIARLEKEIEMLKGT